MTALLKLDDHTMVRATGTTYPIEARIANIRTVAEIRTQSGMTIVDSGQVVAPFFFGPSDAVRFVSRDSFVKFIRPVMRWMNATMAIRNLTYEAIPRTVLACGYQQ